MPPQRKSPPSLPGASGPQQVTNKPAPRVYNPLPTPKVLQKKTVAAPPAYRPQPVPKVLQAKTNNQPDAAKIQHKQPLAPPVFRPQPTPKVLQKKPALGQSKLAGLDKKSAPIPKLPNARPITPPKPSVVKTQPTLSTSQIKRSNISSPSIQRQTGRTVRTPGAARGVIQRITGDELNQLPESYRLIFNQWLLARTLPTAERPEKYKDATKAATHLLSFIPSVDALKRTLDVFKANKKADRERDDEALKLLPHHASKTIAACKTLTDCGVSIDPKALSEAMRILDDDAFFKIHVNLTVDKLKHLDPYDMRVGIGAQLNEETKAFTDKGVSYFKNNPEYSTVIHETLHLLCKIPVKAMLGYSLMEGMTELLTQWACTDSGAKYVEDYAEEKSLTYAAFKAVGRLQKNFVARTYFSDPKEMALLLEAKMGKDRFEQFKSLSDANAALKFLTS